MTNVLITGATGNVGQAVTRDLIERGVAVRAAGRRAADVGEAFGRSVAAVSLDFDDETTWEACVDGIDSMFLMRPPAISDPENNINPFVDFARSRGVGPVVFLSVAGAGENRFVPHRAIEDHLRGSDAPFTCLRPGFFAQNLQTAYLRDIVEDDRIYVPAGDSKPVNWIDARDIGEVAGLVLTEPDAHQRVDYTLAGPGPVDWSEVATTLSRVAGREIRYEAASVPGYALHLAKRGKPAGAIAVQTILHFMLRFGQGAIEDPTLERLLGRPGRSIHQYIDDHAELWTKDDGRT